MNDLEGFAKLLDAIRPWHDKLVLVGGWAHRLHRRYGLADPPSYEPVLTRDADLAFSLDESLEGNIVVALKAAGFRQVLSGSHTPPVSHYTLGGEGGGFYAEFLTPLKRSRTRRTGEPDATVARAGVTAQKLRYLDLLLIETITVTLKPGAELPMSAPARVRLPNPVTFVAQRLLIQSDRSPEKRRQDLLYIHDTIDLFAPNLGVLGQMWSETVRPAMPDRTARKIKERAREVFAGVTDTIREAARIPQDRNLHPEEFRGLCEVGLTVIFGESD
jgi:hypothetical protein